MDTAKAVPYASGVTNRSGTVSFVLNEDADDVKVAFNNGATTNNLGALAKGTRSFPLGGATNFQIIVTKSVAPGWSQISSDTNVLNQFFQTRGVAVNVNPTNAALFGRVYVSSSTEGTTSITGARRTGDGIYVLNADQSDALNRGYTASTAGINFQPTTPANDTQWTPWRLAIGPDNNLYIADYSTNRGTIYRTDPDVTTNILVLEGQGVGANGAAPNPSVHTTISGLFVRGSLETGDLEIQAIDGNTGGGVHNQWLIGAGPLPWNNSPSVLGSQGALGVPHLVWDIDLGPDGKVYTSFYRLNNASANLRVFDTDGTTLLYDSLSAALGGSNPDIYSPNGAGGIQGIKVSPDGTKLAAVRSDNWVFIIPLTNGIPDTNAVYMLPAYPTTPTSGSSHDAAWDAAGNLYVVTPSREAMRVFSPGGATVATTGGDATGTNGTFNVITAPVTTDPYILVQPISLTASLNATNVTGATNILFTALAGGTGPFTYQWQKDGGNIANATGTSVQIPNAALTNAAAYRMIATGANGSVTSSVATLTVATAPIIMGGPPSQTVNVTSNAVFALNVLGATNLSYQWYTNGLAVSGATASSYTKTTTTNDNGMTVFAVVTNSYGAVTSSVATLTVLWAPPTFTLLPQSTNVIAGTNVTFTGVATGIPTPSYQWRFNGVNQSGATTTAFTRSNVQIPTFQGYYTLFVSNAVGTNLSPVAVLTVIDSAPIITVQPAEISTNAGYNVTFRVTTLGSDARTYQWQMEGTNIAGATTSALTRNNVQQVNAGNYRVIVSNPWGSVTSDNALLTVIDGAPTITTFPVSRTVAAGTNIAFSVATVGSDPRTYQWQLNFVDIPGATNSSVTITNAQPTDSGTVSVTINNALGNASGSATLTVTNTPLYISRNPANTTAGAGDDVTLTMNAFGEGTISYQWNMNGVAIPGQTSNTYVRINVQTNDTGTNFSCTVQSSSGGPLTTTAAILTVTNKTPRIVTQPTNLVVNAGSSATFNVVAQGQNNLGYQWTYFGTNITGATASSYTISNAQLANVGNYAVKITSGAGNTTGVTTVTSSTAVLSISGTSTPGTGIGLIGEYFNSSYAALGAASGTNSSITAPPAVTRVDTNVDFTWGTTAPDPIMFQDYFIVRWYGQVQPLYSEDYTFYTRTDDGVRLWINGALVIDKWVNQSPTEWATTNILTLTAGQKYDIRMEYYENTSSAEAHLLWSSAHQFKQAIQTSQLYTNSGVFLIGHPTNTVASPGQPASFTVVARGDGPISYRLLFNGNQIASGSNPTFTLNSVQASDAGNYSIAASNAFGVVTSAVATLTVAVSTTPGTGTGLTGDYYSNQSKTFTNAPTLTRIDPTVDFNFGAGSPDLSISADNFTVRWTGQIQPQFSDVYTFYTRSDDGVQLWVDGQLIIDKLVGGGTNANNYVAVMPYAFVAGRKYDIRLDYYEGTSQCEAHLLWSSPHLAKEIIPQTQLFPQSGAYFLTQPVNQTVASGANATFTTSAGGTPTVKYQWKKNGSNIAGATTTSLTVNNVQFADSGSTFAVVISNAYGTNTSTNATLTVNSPPIITTSPQNTTANVGDNITLSVTATGSPTLSYQWRKDGTNITGATTNTLNFPSVQTSDAGSYDVVVTNPFGTNTSSSATLTVNNSSPPPTITGVSVSGGNINFSWATVSGRSYEVDYKADLNAPGWTFLENVNGTGGSVSRSYPLGGSQRYYRLILLP